MILASAGFALSFNVAAASALIPSVAATFEVSQFFAGKIVWLYMLPYGLAALVYGPLARGVDYKRILFVTTAIFALANLLSAISWNIYILFIARLCAGASGAAIIPLSLILIAKGSSPGERGRKVGGFFSLTFISSLFGLFLSGVIYWRWIFAIPAIIAALVSVVIYFYFPQMLSGKQRISFNYRKALADPQIFRLFVYIFSISFLYHGIRQWLGVYFSTHYGFEQFLISMLLTMISLSGIFGESLGGLLADRLGRVKIINTGVMLMCASVLLLLFKSVAGVLFIIMFAWGLGWTFNHSAVSAFLTDLPQRYLHESASLNSSVRFLSGGLGAAGAGFLAQKSFNLTFVLAAICLMLLFVFSKKLIIKEARVDG